MFETEEKTRLTTIRVAAMFIVLSTFHANGYSKTENELINILIWTPWWDPFNIIPLERKAFEICVYNNYFLTNNRTYLKNIVDFNAVMFNVVKVGISNLHSANTVVLPSNRSASQKYCMIGWEPVGFRSLPESWNGFLNMTITYKLTSNVSVPYIVVKDQNDEVVGPKDDMHWMKLSEMNEPSNYVKSKLQNKHIAAAWIISNCETPWRFFYARHLQKELAKYGHQLDIYGNCGTIPCPRERMEECLAFIETDYYFYLSFENSFGEDYVTDKILSALEHFAVPVVFGDANYTRFMPDGIYLDANVLAPDQMAATMNEIIKDKNKYYDFFRWHDHYSFHFIGEDRYSREACALCAFFNKSRNKRGIMDNIFSWWHAEWPPWKDQVDEPLDVELVIRNFLNFLDPPSD